MRADLVATSGEQMRLRRQARLAAGLLFTPWFLAIFFNLPLLRRQPATALTLLPGLAVAVHISAQLFRHLGANHRPCEEDKPFPTLGAANWITLGRASFIIGLAGLLPWSLRQDQVLPAVPAWTPGMIYLGIVLADLLDGWVARGQRRETGLGKRLDIAADAGGLLLASLLAVALGRLPAIYILVGLAYYPFIFGIWWRQHRGLPLIALQPRPYARIIAGFQMGLVAMALLPVFDPAYLFLAALVFMTPLLAGFWRDWLVVSCRLATGGNRQAALDRWAARLITGTLPVVLRVLVLTGGIATLAQDGPLGRRLGLGACCLLAGVGVIGRSAALFIALLLASSLSPFGISPPSLGLFAAASALMLTGTGSLSLWSPEESILYRRSRERVTTGGAPGHVPPHEVFDLPGKGHYDQ